jgi:hypothetical protein
LPSCTKIESLREKLIEALQYTSCERLARSPERVAHLLLFLPHIRQCSLTAIARMFELGRTHRAAIPAFELLQEMIEARSPMTLPPVMSRRLMDSAPSQQLSPHSSHLPTSPPATAHAPAAQIHYAPATAATSSSSYPMSLPQPRMSHHTQQQQQHQHQLPSPQQQQPQQQPQQQRPNAAALSLPHPRYPPMAYAPNSYHQQK